MKRSEEEEEHKQVDGQQVCLLPGVSFTVIFSGDNIFKQLSTRDPNKQRRKQTGQVMWRSQQQEVTTTNNRAQQ